MFQGTDETAAQCEQKNEIVEMTCLEGGVLAVVGKGQQLAWIWLSRLRVRQFEQVLQCGQCDHGRGGGAAFARQAGQAVGVLADRRVVPSAVQAEAQLSGNEPECLAFLSLGFL